MGLLDYRFISECEEDHAAETLFQSISACALVQPKPTINSITPNPPKLNQALVIDVSGCHSAFEEHGVQVSSYKAKVVDPNGNISLYNGQFDSTTNSYKISFTPTIEGEYKVFIFAEDSLGNRSPVNSITFTV